MLPVFAPAFVSDPSLPTIDPHPPAGLPIAFTDSVMLNGFLFLFLPMPTKYCRIFESVCLSVCLQHNSKTNDPKVFKLGVGNDLGIPWKWYCFGDQRLKVKVTGSITLHNNPSFPTTIAFFHIR